ncbi:MAG: hypothetical protein JWO95_3655 [Verrucomicrobiales bacterium]|nr:hypothetical protein [Verrucomicrobiales bacterium]
MDENQQLLTDYIANGSQDAFRELVARYINFVYSTALRIVGGDTHLAQDVAQDVFIALARKAHTLKPGVALGGWLHQCTYHVGTRSVRSELRRRVRETSAAEMNTPDDYPNVRDIAPLLDEAITQLPADDRAAILLRFFEQQDLRTVAAAIGSSEDAARMRINRALEKLALILKRQGVTLSAVALVGFLSTQAVSAAPAGLATSIAAAALGKSATTLTAALLKLMVTTKVKVATIGLIAAGITTSVVIELQTQAKARELDTISKLQQIQIAGLNREREHLVQLARDTPEAALQARKELQHLGKEIALLRPKADLAARLRQEEQRLKSELEKARDELVHQKFTNYDRTASTDELRAKTDYCSRLITARWEYASKHGGVLASNLNDVVAELPPEYQHRTDLTPNQFEVVYQGTTSGIEKYAHGNELIQIKERTPWRNTDGKLVLVWGTLRAPSSSYFCPKNGDFSEWERQHTVPSGGDPQ